MSPVDCTYISFALYQVLRNPLYLRRSHCPNSKCCCFPNLNLHWTKNLYKEVFYGLHSSTVPNHLASMICRIYHQDFAVLETDHHVGKTNNTRKTSNWIKCCSWTMTSSLNIIRQFWYNCTLWKHYWGTWQRIYQLDNIKETIQTVWTNTNVPVCCKLISSSFCVNEELISNNKQQEVMKNSKYFVWNIF